MIDERVVDRLLAVVGVRRQIDEAFRPAIAVTALVVHQALAHGAIGGVLIGGIDGRHDVQAARVGLFRYCAYIICRTISATYSACTLNSLARRPSR